ncbi:MAG: DUF481 domain-containing protein [Gammaproteobacteria bacterium]|nr:DUF481 domain-containing protein [Gammaproteobacteria bacterium]
MTGRYAEILLWSAMGLCLLPGTACAAGQFKGSTDLGYAASSGNSRTSALNAALSLDYRTGLWRHRFKMSAVSASTDGASTAEHYAATGRSERDYSKHNFAFGQIEYLKDLFAGTRQNISVATGYGRRILDDRSQSLDGEIGAGVRRAQEQKPDLSWSTDAIVQIGGAYRLHISPSSSFEQTLQIQAGQSNTFSEAVTSLKLRIKGNLALRLSYTVDHNTVAPAGLAKTDTYTAIALSYQFGTTL